MSNEVKSDSGRGPAAGASGGYGISSLIASGFSKYGLNLALILLIVFLSITAENFFTVSNMMNILLQSANIGIMAAGLTLVIICAEIDLSVASIQSMGAVVVALLLKNYGVPIVPAVLAALLLGVILAGSAGCSWAGSRFPPSSSRWRWTASRAAARSSSPASSPSSACPRRSAWWGRATWVRFPWPPSSWASSFLSRTSSSRAPFWARTSTPSAANKEAARVAGVNVFAVKLFVLIFSGFCGALAGVVMASRLMAAQAIMGMFDLMDVIAAVVIGGASLLGGEGRVIGTVIGTLIIACIRNGLNLLGIAADWQLLAVGGIIILAVLLDYVGKKRTT